MRSEDVRKDTASPPCPTQEAVMATGWSPRLPYKPVSAILVGGWAAPCRLVAPQTRLWGSWEVSLLALFRISIAYFNLKRN